MAGDSDEWLVGVVLCLLGAAATCLGMVLQKVSHARNERKPPSEQRPYTLQKTWMFGFGVFTVGQALNLVSLSFASQALLATLSSFALVCNVLFAPCLLKEKIVWKHFAATFVIVAGSVLVVLFSTHHPQHYTLLDLEDNFEAAIFEVYASITGTILLACIAFHCCKSNSKWAAPVAAFIASLLGSFSLLLGKCSVQLVKASFRGSNQMKYPVTYVFIAGFALCAISNVHFINMGLQGANALLIVPLYYVLNMLFSIAGGLIYFQEWSAITTPLSSGCFAGGVTLTVIGVYVLARVDGGNVEDELEHLEQIESGAGSGSGAGAGEGSVGKGKVPKPGVEYGATAVPVDLTTPPTHAAGGRAGYQRGRYSNPRRPVSSQRRHTTTYFAAAAGARPPSPDHSRPLLLSGTGTPTRGKTASGRRRVSLQPRAFPGSVPNRARRRYSVAVLGVGGLAMIGQRR